MTRARRLLRAALGSAALTLATAGAAVAAIPSASPIAGDPRSAGEGPGLVGEPFLAIGAVVAIAVLAVIATLAWIRLAATREPPAHRH